MIKRFLGSTALLGAMMMTGEAAYAASPTLAAPKLTISGQSTFNAWWFNQDRKVMVPAYDVFDPQASPDPCEFKGKGRGYLFTVDDSRLKFDITGKTDPGMDYGFTIVVNADTDTERNIKENYLYFGGSWGRLTGGDVDGVEDIMAFYGGDALGGTGGFDGNFDRVVNFTTGTVHKTDLVGETSKSTKVTYQTPRWMGFQLGVSYTPRTEHRGEGKINTLQSLKTPKEVYDTHSFAGAINFINKFSNGWELALSGTMLFGDAHAPCSKVTPVSPTLGAPGINLGTGTYGLNNKFRDTRAFALGFLNAYKGFEWGGEFGWNGRSHEAKSVTYTNLAQTRTTKKSAKDNWFIDTGVGYTWGATKISGGYFYGQRKAVAYVQSKDDIALKKSRTHIFSASVDHKLAPGVVVFTEYAHYNMKNKGAPIDGAILNAADRTTSGVKYFHTANNKANAFVLGTKIKF